jgi:hypothetical protein
LLFFSSLKLSDRLLPLETKPHKDVVAFLGGFDFSSFDTDEIDAEAARLNAILQRRPHDFVIRAIRDQLLQAMNNPCQNRSNVPEGARLLGDAGSAADASHGVSGTAEKAERPLTFREKVKMHLKGIKAFRRERSGGSATEQAGA